jgi:3-methyladenine DNA glycosylase AlkD
MPVRTPPAIRSARKGVKAASPGDVDAVLTWLKEHAHKQVLNDMGPRYGIHTTKAFGVRMADMLKLAKTIGTDHELAAALWDTTWYEARMVACMIDDPARVTLTQMDRWCRDFDNWGICDTVCFKLFDRVPNAFTRVAKWAPREEEFIRRGAFALLACLALHDKQADDAAFQQQLPLTERFAGDTRPLVQKGVSWALRAIALRSAPLRAEVMALAQRLAASTDACERWVGKDVLKAIAKPAERWRTPARKTKTTR